jgi:hypothetical protein
VEEHAAEGSGGGGGSWGARSAPTCGGSFTELLSAPSLSGPWAFATAFGPNTSGAFPHSVDNPAPYFFPNVQHGGFVAFPFSNGNGAIKRNKVELAAHGRHSRVIGFIFFAFAHPTTCRQTGGFYHA